VIPLYRRARVTSPHGIMMAMYFSKWSARRMAGDYDDVDDC
jgi:hypothetical protein